MLGPFALGGGMQGAQGGSELDQRRKSLLNRMMQQYMARGIGRGRMSGGTPFRGAFGSRAYPTVSSMQNDNVYSGFVPGLGSAVGRARGGGFGQGYGIAPQVGDPGGSPTVPGTPNAGMVDPGWQTPMPAPPGSDPGPIGGGTGIDPGIPRGVPGADPGVPAGGPLPDASLPPGASHGGSANLPPGADWGAASIPTGAGGYFDPYLGIYIPNTPSPIAYRGGQL